MSGYIITDTGLAALEAFDRSYGQIRYAAALADGRGFIAFDGEYVMRGFAMEPIPEYPDTWPKKMAPKRGVSNGHEEFAIVSDLLVIDLFAAYDQHITGAVMLSDGNVLIETDGSFQVPLAVSRMTPITIRDKRLLVDA